MRDTYRFFDLVVKRRISISPSIRRIVFTSRDIRDMCIPGPDQRVKMFFPSIEGVSSAIPRGDDRMQAWRAMNPSTRPSMRTYTLRALREDAGEVDVDFVLHGSEGPASRWAEKARRGDRMLMSAPDRYAWHDGSGYEWHPPRDSRYVLLVADETALPALSSILEQIASARRRPERIDAFIEVPLEGDVVPLTDIEGLTIHWLPRATVYTHGSRALDALRNATLPAIGGLASLPVDDVATDDDVVWEQAIGGTSHFYAWIAGEAGMVMSVRSHLVNERGMDRKAMNTMGYWKKGKALE